MTIATLLGITSAKGSLDWRFLILFPANWLAVGFAFMVNDVENAPTDALRDNRNQPNPVAAGLLSPRTARIATILVAIVVIILCGLLGKWPLILGASSLILGFLYSYRRTRLKNIPLFDIFIHCLVFAGFQFLIGYLSFSHNFQPNWFWPFSFILSLSVVGALNQQTHKGDSGRINHQNTTKFLGKKTSQVFKIMMLGFCAFSAVVSLIINDIIPLWVFIFGIISTSLLALFQFSRTRKHRTNLRTQAVLLNSLAQGFALALILQFLIPWMNQVLNMKSL